MRRYITLAEATEYLGISTRTVRRLVMDGEITGYRIGRSGKLIRVDLDEIDEKLMIPIGPYWGDELARPRKRSARPPATDRSTAVTTRAAKKTSSNPVPSVSKPSRPKDEPPPPLDELYDRWCRCGHSGAAHGLRTTWGPGIKPIVGCWSCKCKKFDEDIARRKPRRGRRRTS